MIQTDVHTNATVLALPTLVPTFIVTMKEGIVANNMANIVLC
jgi:hypothetical protein